MFEREHIGSGTEQCIIHTFAYERMMVLAIAYLLVLEALMGLGF